jgi:uncharacterized protein
MVAKTDFHRTFFIFYTLWVCLLALPIGVYAQRGEIPPHNGHWVRDEAGILSQQTVQNLEQFLKQDRDSTSNQIQVYIIKSLEGDDIDDYAVRVFETWKLGQKGKDNGVLYLIAIDDRKFRIEVGDGLEGVLTDLQASRINRDRVAPHFRQGDFDGGVVAGVNAIRETIRGEYVNDSPRKQQGKRRRGNSLYTILAVLGVIIFLSRRRGGGGGGGGGYWSRGGWIVPGAGFGSSSGSWGGGGSDFGGGGFSSGGGSSDSW